MGDMSFATGRLTRVVHPVGKFANGDNRYRRAQFDFLKWDISGSEQQYVLVPPADRQMGSAESIASAVQIHEQGNEFGYYTNNAIVADVNGSHNFETWDGLHSFGHI